MYPAFRSKSVSHCEYADGCHFRVLTPLGFHLCLTSALYSLSVRNMDLLPEGAGEEICQWEKWSERTCWAHIRLWFRWCQGLHWEDTRVRKCVETSALMQTVLAMFFLPIADPAKLQAYLLITNINVVEKLESIRPRGAMSSLVCVTAGMPVGWRPSPRTTLWFWPAAWTSGSLQTRAPAHSAALPSYCRTDPAMLRPAEWEPSCL